jgi:RNA polymerase sigma-70 factor (ECF subfamily)
MLSEKMLNYYEIDIKTLYSLKQGNENAFEAVFRKYNAKIYHFALNTLHDKCLAEDVTQNVFLALWEHRQDIVPQKNFQAYLYTIAKNLIYRETEKKLLAFRYEDLVSQAHPQEEDFSTEETIDAGSLETLILQLIEQLPEARKKIFRLHFTEDLSNKEIAQKLSISEENVEMQIKRSLNFIRQYFQKHREYAVLTALLYTLITAVEILI